MIYGGILASSLLLAKKGSNSKLLNNISEFILAPGSKLFKNNTKKASLINKYFGLDFANKNGKLAMSHGQLTSCVLAGGVGYFGAANDRGKQNLLAAFETTEKWREIPQYSAAVEKMCQENGIPFVNNDAISEEYASLWDPDGIHLQEDFYPLWAANLIMAVYGGDTGQSTTAASSE